MALMNFLRFRKKVPDKGPPPKNFVDVAFDPDSGMMKATDSDNNPVLFDGGSSTDSLTTSDGSAAAAAGKLGEYISGIRENPLGLTTEVSANVASVPLTAGDWDVSGAVIFALNGATSGYRLAGITGHNFTPEDGRPTTTETGSGTIVVSRLRVLVSSPTTIYLTAAAEISAGTVSVIGQITARRVH